MRLTPSDPSYLAEGKFSLGLPSKEAEPGDLLQIWLDRLQAHQEYLDFRDNAYRLHPLTQAGFALDAIWEGDEADDQNLLTVFRHFDSATVVTGLVGTEPDSAWIIDYPTFERIYYDLVVNFNVFGNLSHQMLTRLYMDYLRMESEGLFLSFLPPESRQPLLETWYTGMTAQIKIFWAHSNLVFENPTKIEYKTTSYMNELFALLQQRQVSIQPEPSNSGSVSEIHRKLMALDNNVAGISGWVNWLPELSYILVTDNSGEVIDIASLLKNKAHSNISFIFGEEDRRVPAEDTSTLVVGTIGSYPNFFFAVNESNIDELSHSLRLIDSQSSLNDFVADYGVRRTDSRIWSVLDAVHNWRRENSGTSALLDMSRYQNL